MLKIVAITSQRRSLKIQSIVCFSLLLMSGMVSCSTQSGDVRSFDLGDGVSLEMVWIPEGTFQMGSPESEDGHQSDESPVHEVELESFWMGRYEVTNAQFRKFRSSHDSGEYDGVRLDGDNQPVVNVSWEDAKAFCDWLENRTGQPFTLPTEAQWEYACRAGTHTRFHFGDSSSQLGDYACWDSGATFCPVGQKRPNKFGLYDMSGNVWEWCLDWYGEYTSELSKNPTGPTSGESRVIRGGFWDSYPSSCRSASRDKSDESRSIIIGFRPAFSPVR